MLFRSQDAAYVQAVVAQGAWSDRDGTEYEVTAVTEGPDPQRPWVIQWAVRGTKK